MFQKFSSLCFLSLSSFVVCDIFWENYIEHLVHLMCHTQKKSYLQIELVRIIINVIVMFDFQIQLGRLMIDCIILLL